MSLRSRIMLLVAIGLLVATVPLGVMGLGMVQAATDRVLEERLALTRATADHLSGRLIQGWQQLDQLSARAGVLWRAGRPAAIGQDFRAAPVPLFSGGFFLVDRKGRVLAYGPTASPASRLAFIADNSTVRAVLTTGERQASGLERTADGLPVVFFAEPVFATPDSVVGVVGGIIDLTKPTLLTLIARLAQGSSGHAAIVARDGRVLASTDTDELFTRNEHPDFFARFIAEGRPLVGSAEENHEPGVPNEMHVMAFAPIASVPWGLGIGQNEQETFGPIRTLRDRVIVFEVLVLIAALVFAWLDTSAVAGPLGLLRAASERIAGGDLDQKVEVRRTDEIGSLARSFEAMRTQLRRSLEENARLQERLRSVAMLEERERIAREIHDSVGQVLGYVNTKAQAVIALLDSGKVGEARSQLRQLEEAARDVYADLREAILGLRATTGSGGRLVPVVTEYADRFADLSGLNVHVVVDGDASRYTFDPTTEAHLVRIIQEALTNVRKHAQAHSAEVRFSQELDGVLITIADDGVGFQSAGRSAASGSRFGLQTMRERAEAIGGRLRIQAALPGRGTEVQILLPADGKDANARAAS